MTNSEIINICGGTTNVAKLCGVSPAAVSMWRKANIPQEKMVYLAAQLELLTNGEISRKKLFPTQWDMIWPELL
jgi:DNA-binding transcriptional regulator YdaS (Cro superfamily)